MKKYVKYFSCGGQFFTSRPHFCTVISHGILAVAVVQVTKEKKPTTGIYVGFSETLPRLNQPVLSLIL